jgi:hypothetical protein
MKNEKRVYPISCTSMYCGEYGSACNNCRHKQKLDEFKKWVKDNNAIVKDYIWSPNVYTSQNIS